MTMEMMIDILSPRWGYNDSEVFQGTEIEAFKAAIQHMRHLVSSPNMAHLYWIEFKEEVEIDVRIEIWRRSDDVILAETIASDNTPAVIREAMKQKGA